jgi:hemoglobin/transferrin/lactoferrin receptor protein
MKERTWCCTVAWTLLWIVTTLEGAATPKEGRKAETADDVLALDEMVITPTGREALAFDTSLPVNVLSEDDLRKKLTMNMADVFAGEPGVDVSTTGTGSVRPMIRGLFDERVLILVNGVRLSEQRPGGNHVLSIDPGQIDRIEVVRGPASVLYGSDAIGGVMNIVTKRGDEDTGDAFRYGGEQGLQIESATHGWRETTHLKFGKGRVNSYIGGTFRDTDNLETARGTLNNSFYEGGTAWGGMNYVGDQSRFYLDYSFMQADIGVPAPPVFLEDLFEDERHQMVNGRYEFTPDSALVEEVSFNVGWQRHNRNRRRLRDHPNPALGLLEVGIQLDIDTYIWKPEVVMNVGDYQTVTAGADFFIENATSARTIIEPDGTWVNPEFHQVPVIPDSDRYGAGVYLQDEITFTDRFMVTPGVRLDWIRSETEGHPRHQVSSEESEDDVAASGNVGLLYKITQEFNAFANAGRAFRAPTLLERYFFGPHDAGKPDVGDPDLDPETSWNFDVGVKARYERIRGSVSAFYNRIEDYIVKEDTGAVYEWKNYSDVSLWGGELGAEIDIAYGFSAYGTAAYVRGRNEKSNDPLPSIPPLKARYGIRYLTELGGEKRLWSELGGLSAAKQSNAAPTEERTSGWTRLDFRLGLDMGESWSLVAAVENIFNKHYHDHLSRAWQDFDLDDQAGRNVKVGVVVRF